MKIWEDVLMWMITILVVVAPVVGIIFAVYAVTRIYSDDPVHLRERVPHSVHCVNQEPYLLWVAARSGGFHFDYDAEAKCWRLQGKDDELFSCLARYCSEQAGETVTFE